MIKRTKTSLLLLTAAAVLIFGFVYWWYLQSRVSTDDAYVDGQIHMISSRVQGKVTEIFVGDNQRVKTGEPLLRIDPEPYEVRRSGAKSAVTGGKADLVAAQADLVAAQADVSAAVKAAVEASRANVSLSQARAAQAFRDASRTKALFEREVISREQYEKSQTDAEVAAAQDALARENLRLAQEAIPAQEALIAQRRAVIAQRQSIVEQRRARIGQQEASLRQKEAALAEADLLYGYTTVLSPAEGYVTRKSLEVGQVVSPGLSLLAIAALDNVWVVANYKETDIERIRPGQDVDIRVDTYGGKEFRGKVDSIMAGTGSAFALLPPENASGNYVKVVQRVPVKILISRGEDPKHVLRIGMSVVPTIRIR